MPRLSPGEVWRVDLGLTAKMRPCLILSEFPLPDELALVVVIPHTTSLRHNRWEFVCSKPFLNAGAFHLQQIQPVSLPRLELKLGELTSAELRALGSKLCELLHLTTPGS